jgi:hypothetical protein
MSMYKYLMRINVYVSENGIVALQMDENLLTRVSDYVHALPLDALSCQAGKV